MKLKKQIVQIYLFMMLGIFPLYYQNKYYDMGDAKYLFFKWTAIGMFLALLCAAVIQWDLSSFENLKKKFPTKKRYLSPQDRAVLAYTILMFFSWIFSPFRGETWIGSVEWHMGLFSQLLFCGIYFAVSRYFSMGKWLGIMTSCSAALVFLIAFLHRFRIDPLGMYEGVSRKNQIEFLGTIGQATWYSSYLTVILPLFMGMYLWGFQSNEHTGGRKRFLLAPVLFLGFATSVTQNSDSIYVGLSAALLFFLWFCVEKMESWKRYLEILLIGGMAAKLTGILQLAFPQQVPRLGKISRAVTQGDFTWIAIIVIGFLYLVSVCWKQKEMTEERQQAVRLAVRKLRGIFYGLFLVCLLLIPVIIWMVTTERLSIDGGILKDAGYLVFNDRWGNRRGKNWKYAMRVFQEYSLPMKLFGCGPDGMSFYSEMFHYEEMQEMWGKTIVTNAHNEWLTALVNGGILGAVSYLSIFITAIAGVCKNWRKNPMLLAAGASVTAYMGHNFFCYQQCVCTPLIFIIIGMAAYLCKEECSRYLPKC